MMHMADSFPHIFIIYIFEMALKFKIHSIRLFIALGGFI